MRESVRERQNRLVDVVGQHGSVKVAHLAAILGVSMVTVRRDLDQLMKAGAVFRHHGFVTTEGGAHGSPDTGSTPMGTVAIITPERHAYLNEVMRGAREELENGGYRVVLHPAPNTPNPERAIIQDLAEDDVDGVLLAPRWRSQRDEEQGQQMLAEISMPTVLVERRASRSEKHRHLDSVSSDHSYGVQIALDHLVSQGHERILLAARQDSPTARAVAHSFGLLADADPRIHQWARVLSSLEARETPPHHAPQEPWANDRLQFSPDYDTAWFPDLITRHDFTAALIHSDENALVLSQQISLAGLSIPNDCAIVAYDDVVAGLGRVPLSAVAPPKAEVGRVAAETLKARIKAARSNLEWTPRRIELVPSLAVRSSS